jgi:carotenoid cleavage dioxygenase
VTIQENLAPIEADFGGPSQSKILRILAEQDPFLAHEIFAPVEREVTAYHLPVEGEIPPELNGALIRNGPNANPRMEGDYNWFAGDGMVHGIDLQDGVARWYRNRFVRTRNLAADLGTPVVEHPKFEEGTHLAIVPNSANINVIGFGDKVLALCETGLPHELTRELETVREYDFGGTLRTPMTSHPKIDPVSGELFGIGYSPFEPWLVSHRVDPKTMQVKTEPVDIRGPVMCHDMAITENYVVIPDQPFVFDPSLLKGVHSFPFRYDADYGSRLGLIPRNGTAADIRWYEADEPLLFLHIMNCHDDGKYVHLDVCFYSDLMEGDYKIVVSRCKPTSFDRLTINTETGKISRETIANVATDFPGIDERRTGRAYRYGYAVEWAPVPGAVLPTTRLAKFDVKTGTTEYHDFGPGRWAQEPVFVPAPNSKSDEEGWILTIVGEAGRDGSDLAIIDATRFSEPNPTLVRLPAPVPFGFHGSWIPRSALGG